MSRSKLPHAVTSQVTSFNELRPVKNVVSEYALGDALVLLTAGGDAMIITKWEDANASKNLIYEYVFNGSANEDQTVTAD